MGIGAGIFVFLRPSEHGGKDRTGRPGSREKEIEFERERERERYRKRKTLRVFQIGELYLREVRRLYGAILVGAETAKTRPPGR